MNKRYLSWIFVVAIVLAGIFFIAGSWLKKPAEEPLVLDKPKVENQDVKNSDLVSPPYEGGEPQAKLGGGGGLPPAPSLDRPINITASVASWEKDELVKEIQSTSSFLKNNPKDTNGWISLGNLRKAIGDYLASIEYWNYASILQPNYHVPYNNLGNMYQYYLNDMAKAEENFKKMIEVSPNNEESYKNLFELYTMSYTQKENLALGVLEEGVKNVTHNENLKMMLESYKKEKGIE